MGKEVRAVGLTVLSDPEDAVADIVFVHGLQGHARNTWTYQPSSSDRDRSTPPEDAKRKTRGLKRILAHRDSKKTEDVAHTQEEVFWPEDLLKDDLPKARIMTFGYNTLVQDGLHPTNQGNLFSHARNLLYGLEGKRRKNPTRSLIFVSHSLGGIIVKEVLKRAESDHDEKMKKIYLSTIGVFFFGTPHRGSKWASSAQVAIRIIKIIGLDVNPKIIQDLLPDSESLESCRETFTAQWKDRKDVMTVRSFQESKGVTSLALGGMNQLIVPSESSSLDDPAQHLRAIDENHMNMVKFKGKDDQAYEWVKDDIEELLEKAVDIEKTQFLEDGTPNDVRSKCHQVFRTSNYEQFKDRNPERLDSTCEWFLQHENFHRWKKSDSSDILWVSADPGCGKSVLAKYLVDKEESLQANKDRAVCYFFFKDDSKDQNDLAVAISAILHQLFSQRPDLIPYATKDFKADGDKLPELFQKLWKILLKAADDSKAGEIVCILDGLDECAEKGRDRIIDELVTFHKESLSEKGDARLKFLVTSRPYLDIERRFGDLIRQFPEIRLSGENESESISLEIDKVIRWKLQKLANDLSLSSTEQFTLEKELLSIPQRTYLWATLVFEILNKTVRPTSRKLKEVITSIPPTVDAAYESILSKIDDQSQARKLFSIIVAASRPLTLNEMNVALAIDDDHTCYEELEGDLDDKKRFESTVRAIAGLFISIKDHRIYLIHQTARQFLLAVAEDKPVNGWRHSLDPIETELLVAKGCIRFLTFRDFDDGFDWDENDTVQLGDLVGFDYLEYASNFWMSHFRKAQAKVDDDLIQSVLTVCDSTSRRFKIWSRLFWRYGSSSPILRLVNRMMIASYFGHVTVVKELLEYYDDDIDVQDRQYGRTSLFWAVEQGHLPVVELLVETGKADVNPKDNRDQTPLWLACNMHHEEIALFLLENSADPMYMTDRIQSPLFESAVQGLPKVVSWVLRSMSDEALQKLTEQYNSEGKSILNLAISDHKFQFKIVKSVVDALSRFPEHRRRLLLHQDNSSCSPLFHAALKNQPDIVKFLARVDKELLTQRGWFDWKDTPLHVATHWQNLDAVRALVQAGANPDLQQRNGRTPLHIASERTDSPYGIQILKVLLKRANPLMVEENGRNIVHLALEFDRTVYFDIMQETIPQDSFRQLLTMKNNKGDIPMLHVMHKLGPTGQGYGSETFKKVCDAMVPIVTEADAGFILELVRESDRPFALHRFLETDCEKLVEQIISKVASYDCSLLELKGKHGETLLMKAVERNQEKTIDMLLQNAVDVNGQDQDGKTAVHYAVAGDLANIAGTLVRAKASLTIKDNYGRIPVDWCSSKNSCFEIVKPADRPVTPNPAAMTSSTRSSRSEWHMVLGAPRESCFWRMEGDRTWYPTSLRRNRYLVSEAIPDHIKLPVSRINVVVEARDQGWSHPEFFADRPDGSFTSESSFALAILRNGELVLQREWARNKHRSKTPHEFDCTWYSDSDRNREHVQFGGRKPVGTDDQGEFVRRLAVGDKVVVLALSSGEGWMNIVKSASIEIFFEGGLRGPEGTVTGDPGPRCWGPKTADR